MAQSSFIVADSSATDKTFILQTTSSNSNTYIDTSSTLTLPSAAEISHDLRPAGANGTDRHLVKFRLTVKDAETGEVATALASLQLSIPRHSAVTSTVCEDLVAFVTNYISTGTNLDLILDGITP